jgi:hypothetical protein
MLMQQVMDLKKKLLGIKKIQNNMTLRTQKEYILKDPNPKL